MSKKIKIFENTELNLKMRTIQNSDGSISVNAEDTIRRDSQNYRVCKNSIQ